MERSNGSMPASPLALDVRGNKSGDLFTNDAYEGLTKREHFAGLAMQAILSNNLLVDAHESNVIAWAGKHAVLQADALLKELENE